MDKNQLVFSVTLIWCSVRLVTLRPWPAWCSLLWGDCILYSNTNNYIMWNCMAATPLPQPFLLCPICCKGEKTFYIVWFSNTTERSKWRSGRVVVKCKYEGRRFGLWLLQYISGELWEITLASSECGTKHAFITIRRGVFKVLWNLNTLSFILVAPIFNWFCFKIMCL